MGLCLGVLCLPADVTVAHVISLPGYVFGHALKVVQSKLNRYGLLVQFVYMCFLSLFRCQ